MAWNGTVTCSECYRTGHNKAGCPRRKERYQEALAIPEADRDWGQQRLVDSYESSKKRRSSRKCSYCSEAGHNRRKCTALSEHTGHVARQQAAFRMAFLEHVHDIGLQVGALVQQTGNHRAGAHVVLNIHWDNIDITQCGSNGLLRFIQTRPLSDLGNSRARTHSFTLKSPDTWATGPRYAGPQDRWQEDSYGIDVIGATHTPAQPPEGWLTGPGHIKEFFKDRAAWQWPTKPGDNYYSCEWWDLGEQNQEIKESS